MMSDHILDTHVFIWLSLDSKRLSSNFADIIDKIYDEGRLLVPALAIW
jgi:PIN domain nuclease of toxin-antitoxin system